MILSGKIVWPRIFKPEKVTENDAEAKYSCSLLLPKEDPKAQDLLAVVNAQVNQHLGGEPPEDRYMAIKDGDKSDNADYHGHWEVRCKSGEQHPPGIVDQALEPIIDPAAITGGDHVRIDVNVYAYYRRFRGIGVQLNNVQFISKGDKPIGTSKRRAEDVFEKIDSGTAKTDPDAVNSFLNG